MKNKIWRKTSIFTKFLVSYVFVLLIPFVFFSIVYNASIEVIKKNAINSSVFMLNQIKENVDNKLEKIDERIMEIAYNPQLRFLAKLEQPKEGSEEMFWFWQYYSQFKVLTSLTKEINSYIYVFLKSNQTIFSTSLMQFGFNDFYNNNFRYRYLNFKEWHKIYFDNNFQTAVLNTQEAYIDNIKHSVITYLYSIPMWKSSRPIGVAAVLIDEGNIRQYLKDTVNSYNGCAYILDSKGNTISNYNTDTNFIISLPFGKNNYLLKNINDQKFIYVWVKSNKNGWRYVAVLPLKNVMKEVYYIKNVTIWILIITLIVGLLISLLLSKRYERPLKDILFILKSFFVSSNEREIKYQEYQFIKEKIADLITNHKTLTEKLNIQSITIKNIVLERLLNGQFENEKNINTMLKYSQLDLNGKAYLVAVIRIIREYELVSKKILKELDIFRIVIDEILKKQEYAKSLTQVLNENEIAIIFSFEDGNLDNCHETALNILRNLEQEIFVRYFIHPIIGVGRIYKNISDIQFSFFEAKYSLDYYENESNNIIWYEESERDFKIIYYPIELEEKIINLVVSGNIDGVRSIIDLIIDENLNKKKITKKMQNILVSEMISTLLKACERSNYNKGIDEIINLCSKKDDIHSSFEQIKNLMNKICEHNNKSKKCHNRKLIDQILEFIQQNYTDPNLSMYAIAKNFNLSESYFSYFFKEQVKDKFSDYLEKLRINYAIKLLSEQVYTIDEIAKKCGYISAHTFRRAFKRVTGILPSEYYSKNNI